MQADRGSGEGVRRKQTAERMEEDLVFSKHRLRWKEGFTKHW